MHEYPLRLRVMRALTELLEGIKPDSNSQVVYVNDLSDKVFRGRNWFGESDPLPMVALLETPLANDQFDSPEEAPGSTGTWDISIQGFCEDDKKNPTDPAYVLAADVVQCLAIERARAEKERRQTGKVQRPLLGIRGPNGNAAVLDMQIGSPVCRPPDEISGKAYFWLQITLTMAEDLERPYL